jgi:hypothetical protein
MVNYLVGSLGGPIDQMVQVFQDIGIFGIGKYMYILYKTNLKLIKKLKVLGLKRELFKLWGRHCSICPKHNREGIYYYLLLNCSSKKSWVDIEEFSQNIRFENNDFFFPIKCLFR